MEKEKVALQILEREEEEERKQQYLELQQRKKKQNAIFADEDIDKSEVQNLKLQE